MDTKINELTQLELARTDFQSNVSTLLEVHSELVNKIAYAKSQNKEYISHNVDEVEIISGHILHIATGLCGSYDVIHNTSKLLIFQNRLLRTKETAL
jgi:hypothetical protein